MKIKLRQKNFLEQKLPDINSKLMFFCKCIFITKQVYLKIYKKDAS